MVRNTDYCTKHFTLPLRTYWLVFVALAGGGDTGLMALVRPYLGHRAAAEGSLHS